MLAPLNKLLSIKNRTFLVICKLFIKVGKTRWIAVNVERLIFVGQGVSFCFKRPVAVDETDHSHATHGFGIPRLEKVTKMRIRKFRPSNTLSFNIKVPPNCRYSNCSNLEGKESYKNVLGLVLKRNVTSLSVHFLKLPWHRATGGKVKTHFSSKMLQTKTFSISRFASPNFYNDRRGIDARFFSCHFIVLWTKSQPPSSEQSKTRHEEIARFDSYLVCMCLTCSQNRSCINMYRRAMPNIDEATDVRARFVSVHAKRTPG